MKIIGNPVGTTLPKPDFKQTDPTKGDYIKNKPEIINPSVSEILTIKEIDEDGHVTKLESNDLSNYEFITVEDIDTMWGNVPEDILPETVLDRLMNKLLSE